MKIKIKSFEKMEQERIAAGIDDDTWYLHLCDSTMRRLSNTWQDVIEPNATLWGADCYKIKTPSWLLGSYFIAKWLVEEEEE